MLRALVISAGLVVLAVAQTQLHCVDLVPTPFCEDYQTGRTLMPKKVCSQTNAPVTLAANWAEPKWVEHANSTCPKNPSKYTKEMFCQTNFIPCTDGLRCPSTPKLCYSICMNGAKTPGHTFLPVDQCYEGVSTQAQKEAECDKRVADGEVASPTRKPLASKTDSDNGACVGTQYYEAYYTLGMMAQAPFQPRACRARFPIFNVPMVDFNSDMRVEFMKSLATKLNRIWGYSYNSEPYKWYRPHNIRLRRVQLQKELVQVYAELKEFCMVPLRTGTLDPSLKYNEDQYCDKISASPDDVYANLTKLLDTKKPDRGMMIGQFNVRKGSKPEWPTQCYTWQPEELPKIPRWVWSLTAIGAMCCLLSVLILQHRYRNRASYVRLNEKLRSYI